MTAGSPGVPGSWRTFWQSVVRYQPEKVAPWLALRNSIGVALPLAAGVAAGSMPVALVIATGALNVSFSDSHEPYLVRARRMLAASALVGMAVFAGSAAGGHAPLAVAVSGGWAFAAGMLVSLSAAAADLGVVSLVTLVVFAAVPLSPEKAAWSGLLALGGGLLQTLLALAFWPLRRYTPARRVLGDLYTELARAAGSWVAASEAPPASLQSTAAQAALATLDRDHSVEAERYRLLLSQAERIRLSLLALGRLRARISRESPESGVAAILDRYFDLAAGMLDSIGESLPAGRTAGSAPERLQDLQLLADSLRAAEPPADPLLHAMLRDARFQMDAMAGQLRSAVDLEAYATPGGQAAFARRESRKHWRLRLGGTLATLRSNLSFRSAACRHAVRLAACVVAGSALARAFALPRGYWLPMTVAIVLKPDFTATFSRGVLRLGGTFGGLVLATALFHVLPASSFVQAAVIVACMYLLRCFGGANYGIFVAAVTALVVFLIAAAGVSPRQVIAARGLETLAGGAIALAAYWLWPTWERTQVREAVAQMLDAYREYFRAVRESYIHPESSPARELDRTRLAARLARSNAEASIERVFAEPGTPPKSVALLGGLLASSHRLVHAVMALEAGLAASHPVPPRAAFRPFANDVETALHSLAAALRGSPLTLDALPDLREDHYALVHSGDALTERYALVNVETDRITNSLNTLAGEIVRWAGMSK